MSLLEIEGLTHSFGETLLYKNARLSLNKGEHIGIVGPNGTGKSTLIKICTEQIVPDAGRVIWQPKVSVGFLDQYAKIDKTITIQTFLKSAFAKWYQLEKEMMLLYEKAATRNETERKTAKKNAADGNTANDSIFFLNQAAEYQEQLEIHNFYSADTQIEQVASGLGLLSMQENRPLSSIQGIKRLCGNLTCLLPTSRHIQADKTGRSI